MQEARYADSRAMGEPKLRPTTLAATAAFLLSLPMLAFGTALPDADVEFAGQTFQLWLATATVFVGGAGLFGALGSDSNPVVVLVAVTYLLELVWLSIVLGGFGWGAAAQRSPL